MDARTSSPRRILLAAALAVLAAYGLVLAEWLFFVTHPSLAGALAGSERLGALLVPALLLAGAAALAVGLLRLLAAPAPGRAGRPAAEAVWLVPALLLGVTAFLLLDNFTYTLFGFGVETSAGWRRYLYALLLAAVVLRLLRGLRTLGRRPLAPGRRRAAALAALLLPLASVAYAGARWAATRRPPEGLATTGTERRFPNVLFVLTDGLDARRTSLYGYGRRTTPTLERLAARALVCENAFANASVTAASGTSLLTGRLPTRVRVYYQGQILSGADAYRHLPGVLRRLGYTSIALGPGVVDPFDRNLRDSFDVANHRRRTLTTQGAPLPERVRIAYSGALYFIDHVSERLSARLQHAVGRRAMVNQLREVRGAGDSDEERVSRLLDFVEKAERPVFAYVHLMGTHGPFAPRQRTFSAASTRWQDAYDDAILDFDAHVDRIVSRLAAMGKLDETLLVVSTDHGHAFSTVRIPLLFLFPGGAHAGRIAENVQLLDVGPTVLDYLGVRIPPWMDGTSLLGPRPDPMRPIFTLTVDRERSRSGRIRGLGVTYCHRLWELDLAGGGPVRGRDHAGHTAPCSTGVPHERTAFAALARHLRDAGYDVDELRREMLARGAR